MSPEEFFKKVGPDAHVFSDNDGRILASITITAGSLSLAVCSTMPHSDILHVDHRAINPTRISTLGEITYTDSDIEDAESVTVKAREYPLTQRRILGQWLEDSQACKLVDGAEDAYSFNPVEPPNYEAFARERRAALVELEASTTMLAVSEDGRVARLGNAILYPVELVNDGEEI